MPVYAGKRLVPGRGDDFAYGIDKSYFYEIRRTVATNRHVTNCISDFLPTGCELDTEPNRHRHATVVDHMQRGHVIVLLS